MDLLFLTCSCGGSRLFQEPNPPGTYPYRCPKCGEWARFDTYDDEGNPTLPAK